ncbi:uncharacterized protein IUM83_08152 [Phytophthora cinnamomi]|uniref:uncharacterized protein n=1 Tax=Phytophthora cinnamomi TaxID=4785 RepID=UPI002A3211C1|nr:hypothetical protein IUM83_08152 [Phytophthora cinnamomi]KAJ8571493.1 hypothetical protein ON010_g5344 [Phytophthora cinnamomi]
MFEIFLKNHQDPDEMFTFFKLDPRVAGVKKIDYDFFMKAAKEDEEVFADYYLWHSYAAYYKSRNPDWVSNLE